MATYEGIWNPLPPVVLPILTDCAKAKEPTRRKIAAVTHATRLGVAREILEIGFTISLLLSCSELDVGLRTVKKGADP
jgi:hypothetical protein